MVHAGGKPSVLWLCISDDMIAAQSAAMRRGCGSMK